MEKNMAKKTYRVKVIHEFIIEADNEEQAEEITLTEKNYSEARDCYLEVEEW